MRVLTLDDEFPVTRHWAFLDHAAVAPPTARAQRALVEWMDDMTNNGVVNESMWLKRIEEIRRRAAQFLHADSLDVAFVKNTSEGIGFVADGFPWQEGDNVVIAADEYPANVYPWMNLARRGVETRRVPSRGPRIEIDDLRRAIDARTRVVSLSHVEFATGFRNDLDAIGALCRERDIFFVVDAIQGLGVLPIDVEKTPIDALAADGHKWLLGPEGAGIFWLRRDKLDLLRPVSVGWHSVVSAWNFSTIDFRLKAHAGRYESGTLNIGGIVALGASLDLLWETGLFRIEQCVLKLTDRLCELATQAGMTVFSSRAARDRSGIVSLELPGTDTKEMMKRCRAEKIVVNVRGGRLRVSPHFYNTPEDLDRLMKVLTT